MGTHAKAPEKKNYLTVIFTWVWKEGKHLIILTSAGLPAIFAYEFLLSPHSAENVHHITNVL